MVGTWHTDVHRQAVLLSEEKEAAAHGENETGEVCALRRDDAVSEETLRR